MSKSKVANMLNMVQILKDVKVHSLQNGIKRKRKMFAISNIM